MANSDVGKSWDTATGIQRLERLRLAIVVLSNELEQRQIIEKVVGKVEVPE